LFFAYCVLGPRRRQATIRISRLAPAICIEGPWNDYGNIFYQRNDPESTLRFTTWLQDKDRPSARRTVPYEAQLVRARDGKVIGLDKGDLHPATHWEQIDLYFQPPGGDQSSHLKAGDVLHDDGNYQVRFTLDGKILGVYSFVGPAARFSCKDARPNAANRPIASWITCMADVTAPGGSNAMAAADNSR